MKTDTVIIGGGQAGLSLSYYLKEKGTDHIVLEKAVEPANTWRNERWDSFTLVSPNWSFRLPGAVYNGDSPDGFMTRDEVIRTLESYVYKNDLPVIFGQKVISVHPESDEGGFTIITDDTNFKSNNVVIATGSFQKPGIPECSTRISSSVKQLHSGEYHNPYLLPPGNVLIIGSAQSGCQITDELLNSGRKVYLSTGSAGRVPRRYRGKDIFEWLSITGFLDRTADMLPDPSLKFSGNPHISGANGGKTLNLHEFARRGAVLLGRLKTAEGTIVNFAPDMKTNLTNADEFELSITRMIDNYINEKGLEAPPEKLPQFKNGFSLPDITEIDLKAEGITSIIWACGYTRSYDIVKIPVFDNSGYPIHTRGVTSFPGLYFLGLVWLHKNKSSLFAGVGEDAEYLAQQITSVKARLRYSG